MKNRKSYRKRPDLYSCVVAVLSFAAGAAIAQSISDRAQNDQTINMAREEPAMRTAMEKGRATLDQFLSKAKAPAEGTAGYAVKVGISDGRNTEYFWIAEFTATGTSFSGVIHNQPEVISSVKSGQTYSFNRDQIVDWTYFDEAHHKMLGNFTACALLSKEPAEEAAEFKRSYGLDCS
jgi:uncharacterized protein YegJ (DUF2314 family)